MGFKCREGDSSCGTVFLTSDGQKARRGDSSYGQVVLTLDGNKLREGDSALLKKYQVNSHRLQFI
jgi:hypothetical protein